MSERRHWEFDLCEALGIPHPDYLYELLSPGQYDEWVQHHSLRPIGNHRQDMRMARIVWALTQPHSKTQIDETDYLFHWRKTLTPEDYKEKSMTRMLLLGGKLPPSI
jgi:hypothetical protein